MGVFERAPETGRLHFHALLYVLDGEMIGTITEKQDYSTKQHKMQTTHENDFFAERFGRNDFAELSAGELQHGNTIGYSHCVRLVTGNCISCGFLKNSRFIMHSEKTITFTWILFSGFPY